MACRWRRLDRRSAVRPSAVAPVRSERAGRAARCAAARRPAAAASVAAVGAGVDVSRDDHGRLTKNVAVTKTTTTPIATHASEREILRGAGGSGSEAVGVVGENRATVSRTVAASPAS